MAVRPAYLERFRHARAHLRAEVRFITPAWAAEVLGNANNRNRRLSNAGWRRVLGAIRRDSWWVNGEAVVFDTDGRLINGQHRLRAIAEGEDAVPCLVVYGVHPAAFTTFDQQKKRNPADVLSIDGYEHTSLLAAAIGWRQAYDAGELGYAHARVISNDEVIGLASKYPELVQSAAWSSQRKNPYIPPGLLAFLHSMFAWFDQDLAAAYFERVVEGVGLVKGTWEFSLRKRLEDMIGRRTDPEQVEVAALCVKVWNRLRQNVPVPGKGILVWKMTEPFPEIV